MHWLRVLIFLSLGTLPAILNAADSLRIISFPKHLHLHVKLNSAHSQIDIRNPDIKENLQIKLNAATNLKIGFFYSWLGLSYSFILPSEKEKLTQYGKSSGYALEAHMMKTRLMVDLMYKKYQGYYLSNPDEFIPDWKESNLYPQMPDLRTKILSLSMGYVFRPDKFSPTAAYAYTKAMRRSGGSWVAGGFASISTISSDSSIVSKPIVQWVDHKLDLKDVTFTDVGASFGYAFLLTILKKNFVSFSILPGFSYQHISQQSAIDLTYKSLDAISIRTTIRLSMGHNGDKFYWGFNTFVESGLTRNLNTELGFNSGYAEFFFGYRINTENWRFVNYFDKIRSIAFFCK